MKHITDYDFSIEEENIIQTIFEALKTDFDAEFDDEVQLTFDGFELFTRYLNYGILMAIKVSGFNRCCHLTFTGVDQVRGGQISSDHIHSDRQNWIIANLNRDFGHVIIKHPTLLDKLMNLLTHTELKFNDDQDFHDRFHVLASDHTKASLAITPAFRNAVTDFAYDDMIIEIVGKKMIIGNLKTFTAENAVAMVLLADKIMSSLK
jgi:hypothetical protein